MRSLILLAGALMLLLTACAVSTAPPETDAPPPSIPPAAVTAAPEVSFSAQPSTSASEMPTIHPMPTEESPFATETPAADTQAPKKTVPPATQSPPSASIKPTPSPTTAPTPIPTETPTLPSVTVSINTPDKVLLEETQIPVVEGMTAEQALKAACEEVGLELDIRAADTRRAYIVAIGGYTEFGQGPGSGWKYMHNGEDVLQGIGVRKLQEGDTLRFWYTLDYGKEGIP